MSTDHGVSLRVSPVAWQCRLFQDVERKTEKGPALVTGAYRAQQSANRNDSCRYPVSGSDTAYFRGGSLQVPCGLQTSACVRRAEPRIFRANRQAELLVFSRYLLGWSLLFMPSKIFGTIR